MPRVGFKSTILVFQRPKSVQYVSSTARPLQTRLPNSRKIIYSIHYGNEDASSPVSDVGRYVFICKFTDYIFNVLPVFIRPMRNPYILTQDFSSLGLHTHHPPSYLMGTGGCFPGVKATRSEADHSTSNQCRGQEYVDLYSLPQHVFMA
jgi:hypothetical protein